MNYDAIIVGGGFAGLSATLTLARARKKVALIDAGKPRNRFTRASHGYLGMDGKSPEEIKAQCLEQLQIYPTIEFISAEVVSALKGSGGFVLNLKGDREIHAARLVLATGVKDKLPHLTGLEARWGISALHCPYCHGFEVSDQPLGVMHSHFVSSHQAMIIPDWGPTTYFTQGLFKPDRQQEAIFAAKKVRLESSPIVELLGNAPDLEAVKLQDGRVIPLKALFVTPTTTMASPLAEQLGCEFDEGPFGKYLRVNEWNETTVKGIYAAGDMAHAAHNAIYAAAGGATAGVGVHQSLIFS
ncbi:NAD(P)/FAD-dependent oxidoreductase [Gynuella sp.]|uniref:NAD(P)/FAD-dependent oxidoreductase n=1 Tax=Gynuella sp. TaxID=2969146 RepID=UPI003D11279E